MLTHRGWSPLLVGDTGDGHRVHHGILPLCRQHNLLITAPGGPLEIDSDWLSPVSSATKHWVALHSGLSLAPIVLLQRAALHCHYINVQHFSSGVRRFAYDPFSSLGNTAQVAWQPSIKNAKTQERLSDNREKANRDSLCAPMWARKAGSSIRSFIVATRFGHPLS